MRFFLNTIAAALLVLTTARGSTTSSGYLADADLPDASKFLQAFPAPGSELNNYEVDVYNQTRTYEHSTKTSLRRRWNLATSDSKTDMTSLFLDFSCALNATLTPQNAPHLVTVVSRSRQDVSETVSVAKNFFNRNRPFVGNT